MTDALILVDADACPVKDEIYRVALRRGVRVRIVSNGGIRIPDNPLVSRIIVGDSFDAADDYIADNADAGAIVVTADILLADRCLKNGASVIAPNGKPFTPQSIGAAIATRAIMQDLRGSGDPTAAGRQKPFSKEDRSRFLQALDLAITRAPH
ncbi:MAG: YaiI/YqxD family protein [Parvularculaceae bacterium]|nr:YaiI/YqxD family protein [Parvularculaceae bacterium]